MHFLKLLSIMLATFGCKAHHASKAELLGADNSEIQATELATFDIHPGGIKSIRTAAGELCVGNCYYLIASCTGEDKPATNVDSTDGSGVLHPPSSNVMEECKAPTYSFKIVPVVGQKNRIRTSMKVVTGDKLGVLSFALDLDKNLSPYFAFSRDGNPVAKWEDGCANDFQDPLYFRTPWAAFSTIRKPCPLKLPDGSTSYVGLAKVPAEASLGLSAMGPLVEVTRKLIQIKATDSHGNAIQATQMAIQGSIFDHPYTHSLGPEFLDVPPATTIELTEELTVAVKKQRPCGRLAMGEQLMPGEKIVSCNGLYELRYQATDSNIVLYKRANNEALKQTATSGTKNTANLVLGTNGRLQLMQASRDGADKVVWKSSNAEETRPCSLIVGHSGRVTIVRDDDSKILWEM